MNYRKVALRVLFYSLGIAALAGVLAMILPDAGSVIGRLIGTAISTAVASALLLVSIQRYEVHSTRIFGASLGIQVLVIYLCAIITIWAHIILPFRGLSLEEKFGVSALLFAGCGTLITSGFLFIRIKRLQIAGLVLSGIWSISLILWLLVAWSSSQPMQQQLAENIAFPLQTVFPIIVLACIRRHPAYMTIAIVLAVLCCIGSQVAMFMTNGHIEQIEPLFNFILVTGGLSAFLGIANIIYYRSARHGIPWAERITLVCIGITLFVLAASMWYEMQRYTLPELIARLAVGMSILSSTSIIGLLIWQLLRSSAFANYDGTGLKGICPRCQTALNIPSGKSSCFKCGLRMKVHVESSNCSSCGYDITKISDATTCPECGKPILLVSTVQ